MSSKERASARERERRTAGPESQAADQWWSRVERMGWAGGWVAVLALAAWTRWLVAPWLALATAGLLAWTFAAPRGRARVAAVAAAVLLWAGAGLGYGVQLRLGEIASRWPEVRLRVEERAADALRDELAGLVERGEWATEALIRAAAAHPAGSSDPRLFTALAEVRDRARLSAVAVYGPDGQPIAWAGEHRGEVPEAVRRGEEPYAFAAGPLFSYLYFATSPGEANTAIAAVLLEGSAVPGEGSPTFAAAFRVREGLLPRFTPPERARGESVWDWGADEAPILSATFATLTQEGWRARVVQRGRHLVWGGGLVTLVLLAFVWFHRPAGSPAVPVLATTFAFLLVPLGDVAAARPLFSPLDFILPVRGDVTLGQLLIVLVGVGVWLLARRARGERLGWIGWFVRVALAAAIAPAAVVLVEASAASAFLARQPAGGVPLAFALSLALAVALRALLGGGVVEATPRRQSLGTVAALALAGALSVGVVAWWAPGRTLPAWTPALWAAPFALLALAPPLGRSGRGALIPWLATMWIAGAAALPHLWILHLDARLRAAEAELAHLGTEPDPFLEFLLQQFSEQVLFHAAEGETGVNLLYRSWVTGGLAAEGYEARVTLWQGDRAEAELRLSDGEIPTDRVAAMLRTARAAESPLVERDSVHPGVHYMLLVPLPGERVVSVAVPPRRALGRSTAVARFLDPAGETSGGDPVLSLAPATASQARPGAPGPRWVHTSGGWQSESTVPFPGGPMHAHFRVRTPPALMLATRALLFQTLLLAGAAALWMLAGTLRGEPLGTLGRLGWLASFRGRLALALFGFFLLPLLLLGAVLYQALAREAVRTAGALAERAVEQAATEAAARPLGELAEHVDADLLLYRDGVLQAAAAPEVLQLGLYPTWLPPAVFQAFRSGEGTAARQERRLGAHEYLIAYRRLGTDRVLASPTPLAAGEIARRQRELADVVLLSVLVGAALSVVLALVVSRALSEPIVRLSHAAATVGAGDLGVRLEEARRDEFGGLFRSFNRMVRRLRHARSDLLRETRRTDAILAEASTGIVALDPHGRVRVINPRATELLGVPAPVGAPLPDGGGLPAAVAATVARFRASSRTEGGEEIQTEGRTVRLRMRRFSGGPGDEGGIVAALEDISDEIRSARVLAWGEMARQVAHEIKNPLTPIKLSVQHLRRAYADGRPDFAQILERNVDAVLQEIDRLGEIARAFARFGTPPPAPGDLEAVDVSRVVEDTLALYRGGRDGIHYMADLDGGVPPARARAGELKEVLVNLLENARAALGEQGEIRVASQADPGGAWVELTVADTGEGIAPDALPRIWDPHFSTRSSGTGLGLAIVRRLVEGWGGTVDAESVAGRGTTARMRLPVAE